MTGPWPPEHRPWCSGEDCQFTPELSAEGTHVGPETVVTTTGATAGVRLAEIVPSGTGPIVLLRITERQGTPVQLAEVTAAIELTPAEARELAGRLHETAARAVGVGGHW